METRELHTTICDSIELLLNNAVGLNTYRTYIKLVCKRAKSSSLYFVYNENVIKCEGFSKGGATVICFKYQVWLTD